MLVLPTSRRYRRRFEPDTAGITRRAYSQMSCGRWPDVLLDYVEGRRSGCQDSFVIRPAEQGRCYCRRYVSMWRRFEESIHRSPSRDCHT
ncbi:MAG: hypothetical protein ACREX8_20185 [Gammaproteobacteria bacterium]